LKPGEEWTGRLELSVVHSGWWSCYPLEIKIVDERHIIQISHLIFACWPVRLYKYLFHSVVLVQKIKPIVTNFWCGGW
jgi:hypothetical protein